MSILKMPVRFGKYRPLACMAVVFAVCLAAVGAVARNFPEKAQSIAKDELRVLQKDQKARQAWSDEKREMVARLEALEVERDALRDAQKQIKERIDAAGARVAAKEAALDRIEEISASLRPFLDEILGLLEGLLAEKPHFLMQEREERLARLRETLMDPEVPVNEQYRKAFEALFVEAEYGRTIETSTETVNLDGESVLAEVFRLGRLSLFCRTLNKETTGVYDIGQDRFVSLADDAGRDVGRALDIGARRRPVELLILPVGRIVTP